LARWPLQDIVLLRGFVHESIIRVLPAPTCIARTITVLLHVYCAIYDAPPTPRLHAIQHTLLTMAIPFKANAHLNREVHLGHVDRVVAAVVYNIVAGHEWGRWGGVREPSNPQGVFQR